MMFQNWNWWYLFLPLVITAYFGYGYSLHYADGCATRDRAHLEDWQEVALWVVASAGLCAMMIAESYRGFFQVARMLLGGRGEDLDELVGGLFLMTLAVIAVFALVFFAPVLGEAIGHQQAKRKALAHRAYCRSHGRSEVCWACKKSQHYACPVGIDRTPVWVISRDQLLETVKAIDSGETNGEPIPYEIRRLPSGAEEFVLDMPIQRAYGDKPPRRLTTPPELKVGVCVKAILTLPGMNRTEQDVNVLRAVLRSQDEPLAVKPQR